MNGELIPVELTHKYGATYPTSETAEHYGSYFGDCSTVEEFITRYSIEEFVSYWYDKNEESFNYVINTDMSSAPIRLIRRGNQIVIDVNLKFKGSLSQKLFEGTNETYSDLAIKGITRCWTGRYYENHDYDLFGCDYVDVCVNINNNSFSQSLDFYIGEEGIGICLYNVNWGIGGSIMESLYCNAFQDDWYYGYEQFAQLAAHEFGHLLGLGDAYPGQWQKEIPITDEVPEECLMRDKAPYVMSNDIEMALEAFKTNSLQIYDRENGNIPLSKVIRLEE